MEIQKTEYLAFVSNFDTHATAFIVSECSGEPDINAAHTANPDSFFKGKDGKLYHMMWRAEPMWEMAVRYAEFFACPEIQTVAIIGLSGTCTLRYCSTNGELNSIVARDGSEAARLYIATPDGNGVEEFIGTPQDEQLYKNEALTMIGEWV